MDSPKYSMMDFFLDEESSDFIIRVENGPETWNFPVNSFLLKKHSPVFKAMLDSNFLETTKREITIYDFKFTHVKKFLRYMYDNSIPDNCMDLTEVAKMADKYQVTSLLEKCSERLTLEIRMENVFALLAFADQYNLQNLEKKSLELIKQAAFVLLESDDFEMLPQHHVEVLLSSDDLNVIDELQVLRNALRWLKFNKLGIDTSAKTPTTRNNILQLVRWQLIDENYVKQLLSKENNLCNIDVNLSHSPLIRIPRVFSLVNLSNSLDFQDFALAVTEVREKNVIHQCRPLSSLEPSVFTTGLGVFNNSDFKEFGHSVKERTQKNVGLIHQGLSLTSLESSTVFITGIEVMSNDSTKHYVDSVELINSPVAIKKRKIFSFPKPYVLKSGDSFTYSFQRPFNVSPSTNQFNTSAGSMSQPFGFRQVIDNSANVPTFTLATERTSLNDKLKFLCAGGEVTNLTKIFFLKQ